MKTLIFPLIFFSVGLLNNENIFSLLFKVYQFLIYFISLCYKCTFNILEKSFMMNSFWNLAPEFFFIQTKMKNLLQEGRLLPFAFIW